MGQKVNPNIFQLSQTNVWDSKYIEKKPKDFYLYTAKDLEIKKFIVKFFEKNGLNIHKCKINYLNNILNIFITYQQNVNSVFLINELNKTQKIKLTKKIFSKKKRTKKKTTQDSLAKTVREDSLIKIFEDIFGDMSRSNGENINPEKNRPKNNSNKILDNIKNYFNYENISYRKNFIEKKVFSKKLLKVRRVKMMSYYKKYLSLKLNKNIHNIKMNNFFNNLFESINLFYNKLFKINLILQPLNNNIKRNIKKKKHASLHKKLISLQKYQRNEFFKEGVNLMFTCITHKNSANLLAKYISTNLKKLKRHNFFFRFIKTTLTKFKKIFSSRVKGIKIKIKGRINRRPRAKYRIITIGRTPVITLKSLIDYSETIAYTSNGTLGVKVWICTKNK